MKHAPGFLALVDDAKSRVQQCDCAAVQKRLQAGERFQLIDVREDSEWAAGHLPGAIHLGRGIIERDIEKNVPDHATPMVLYCGGGFRSALAADSLARMGYTNVISMDGGWRVWNESGFPVEHSAVVAKK